jgi:serine/threonine protein kinase
MSPERIQGLPHSFDSDLWSLGLTIMECALGIFPYAHDERKDDEPDERKQQTSPFKNNIPRATRSRKSNHLKMDTEQHDRALSISVANATNTRSNDSTCSSNTSTPSNASFPSPSHATLNSSVLYSPSSSLAPPLSPATASSTSPSPNTSPTRLRSNSLSVQPNADFYNSTQTVAPSPSQLLRAHASSVMTGVSAGSAHSSGSKSKKKSRFGFWDIMEKIVQSTPPTLATYHNKTIGGQQLQFTEEFQDFIAQLLHMNPKDRPTARKMLVSQTQIRHISFIIASFMHQSLLIDSFFLSFLYCYV